MNASRLWWSYVPTGAAISDNVVKLVREGKCALLDTSRLPWEETLQEQVFSEVLVSDPELNCNVVDASLLDGQRPIDYLGSYYGVDEIRVEKMILQKLRGQLTCCWVYNIPQEDAARWLRFAREMFEGDEGRSFRLVLEMPVVEEKSYGKIVPVDATIERFDVYYFALSMLAGSKLCKYTKEYAATLCAEIAGSDVELCDTLCRNVEELLRKPGETCLTDGDESRRRQLICRAQTRSIGPLVDIGRLGLISRLRKRIQSILPQEDDYGHRVEDVNAVELRHLQHFYSSGLITLNPAEWDTLHCLHEARNALSHLEVLSYSKIQAVFKTVDSLS